MEGTGEVADNLVFIEVDTSVPVKQEALDGESSPDVSLSTVKTRSKDKTNGEYKVDKEGKAPPASKFYCNKCDYNTYHRSVFQEHLNRHQGIKPYKCKLCPYSSVSKHYTKKHEERHAACPCGFISLKSRTEFKRHLRHCAKNTARKPEFGCKRCRKEFVDEKGLSSHVSRMQICSVCSEECCSLRAHMAQVHGEKPKLEHKRFECALCPWSCSLNQKILLHLIHHPQPVDDAVVDVSVLRRFGILPESTSLAPMA